MSDGKTYKMTVDLNVLEHLGVNLYSNMAAVLTEAVANAWDADATVVSIDVEDDKSIIIRDDGFGMTVEDMNNKYLRVGYRRREQDDKYGTTTPSGRPVMGRKGLGKLSLFSLAEEIEIQSAKDGEKHGLKMTVEGIKQSVDAGESHYSPDPLPERAINISAGTQITLRRIRRERLGRGVAALRKRLSRRFSVIGEKHNFKVLINGEPLTTKDRGDIPVAQFIWKTPDYALDKKEAKNLAKEGDLISRLDGWNATWQVTGWIGTSAKPSQLDDEEAGNLNSIVVFSRGRLFQENILDQLNDGRLYTKYLTGQIEADFLDANDQPDIATSDRQRLQQSDARYVQLSSYIKSALTKIEKQWGEWRPKEEEKDIGDAYPALGSWLEGLPPGHKDHATKLLSKVLAMPLDNEEDRKDLLKNGVVAFERMRIRGSTEDLAKGINNIPQLLTILADRDSLEASLYRDIVKTRLDAIRRFQGLTEEDAKEQVLQEYLFDHMWLLDPSWERATNSEVMETKLLEEGVIVDDLTEKEKLGRVDIAYRSVSGKHVIVELKRYGRKMKLIELYEQGAKYKDKVEKIGTALKETRDVEIIFVLGEQIDEEGKKPERIKHMMNSISPGSKIIYYDALINGALKSYSEYLEATRELDNLDGIIDSI